MVDALVVEIPDAKVRCPEGGYFWAELPAGIAAKKLVERGIARSVEVSPGRVRFSIPILRFSCVMHTTIRLSTTSAKASADWARPITRWPDRRISSPLYCSGDH